MRVTGLLAANLALTLAVGCKEPPEYFLEWCDEGHTCPDGLTCVPDHWAGNNVGECTLSCETTEDCPQFPEGLPCGNTVVCRDGWCDEKNNTFCS